MSANPTGEGSPSGDNRSPDSVWFWEHYDEAANHIINFFGEDGISLAGKSIADIGCGDGITDLGVAHKAKPSQLVGFDVNLTNTDHLLRRAAEEGVATELPTPLKFVKSESKHLPAEDASFDILVTWSAFEHISDPLSVLEEMRRVVRSDGLMFLQLWPFYFSERGSHLWDWFPEPFHHLVSSDRDVLATLETSERHPRDWTEMMAREFSALNRITVDELQRCILSAGFSIRKFALETNTTHLTPELSRYPLSQLGITGVKLLATPI